MEYWDSFKKNNEQLWHFDPKRTDQDYSFIGNLQTDFDDLLQLTENEDAFKKIVLTDTIATDNKDVLSRIQGFKNWGYNEHNACTFQIFDDKYPEVFSRYNAFTNLESPTAFIVRQDPGQSIPWHYDTFFGYMKKNSLEDDKSICRYLIFLEDWEWGQAFLSGNSVVHQWQRGDIIHIPYRMHHASCNVGMMPKFSLIITGIATEASLHNNQRPTYTLA